LRFQGGSSGWVFPAESVALTAKVCAPSARGLSVRPELQGPVVDFRTFIGGRGIVLNYDLPGQPALAGLQELLGPSVIEPFGYAFTPTQLGNAVLAAQAGQHNADLLFSGMMPACGSANIPDSLFSAVRYALARLSHRCSSTGRR
jgi:hypothetical protein